MRLQRYNTRALDIIALGARDAGAIQLAVPFQFAGPGARSMLTLKTSVRQNPRTNPIPFDWTVNGSVHWFLWLCRSTFCDSGQRIPTANLLGTRANPVQLDEATSSTNGFSVDISGGMGGVDGELSFSYDNINAIPVFLVASIRGRYNAIAPMCDAEWAAVESRCGGYPNAKQLTVTNSIVLS